MASKSSRKTAYKTKTSKGDFNFKYQERSKPYVTKLQMALAKDHKGSHNHKGAKRGAFGFHPRPGGRHGKNVPTWLA